MCRVGGIQVQDWKPLLLVDREVQQGPIVKYCIKFSVAGIVPSKRELSSFTHP